MLQAPSKQAAFEACKEYRVVTSKLLGVVFLAPFVIKNEIVPPGVPPIQQNHQHFAAASRRSHYLTLYTKQNCTPDWCPILPWFRPLPCIRKRPLERPSRYANLAAQMPFLPCGCKFVAISFQIWSNDIHVGQLTPPIVARAWALISHAMPCIRLPSQRQQNMGGL